MIKYRPKKVLVADINFPLTCILCGGYFIDATTIVECLHSFCRSCIVKYLETCKHCPICDVIVYKVKPFLNLRSDKMLQDIVYKLIPGLLQNELQRRRKFYEDNQDCVPTNDTDAGQVNGVYLFPPDECISLKLEYASVPLTESEKKIKLLYHYLNCPILLSVMHLKKFIFSKYGLDSMHEVQIKYDDSLVSDDLCLMDIAYLYEWDQNEPLRLIYQIFKKVTSKRKVDTKILCNKRNMKYNKSENVNISGQILYDTGITNNENNMNKIKKEELNMPCNNNHLQTISTLHNEYVTNSIGINNIENSSEQTTSINYFESKVFENNTDDDTFSILSDPSKKESQCDTNSIEDRKSKLRLVETLEIVSNSSFAIESLLSSVHKKNDFQMELDHSSNSDHLSYYSKSITTMANSQMKSNEPTVINCGAWSVVPNTICHINEKSADQTGDNSAPYEIALHKQSSKILQKNVNKKLKVSKISKNRKCKNDTCSTVDKLDISIQSLPFKTGISLHCKTYPGQKQILSLPYNESKYWHSVQKHKSKIYPYVYHQNVYPQTAVQSPFYSPFLIHPFSSVSRSQILSDWILNNQSIIKISQELSHLTSHLSCPFLPIFPHFTPLPLNFESCTSDIKYKIIPGPSSPTESSEINSCNKYLLDSSIKPQIISTPSPPEIKSDSSDFIIPEKNNHLFYTKC